ncbi:MAG: peptide deformylase [Kiloniellales bacterium]
MALLPVIIAPDARLKQKCAAVERVDDAVRRLMDDMVETMHQAPGIGLAAPQVGVLKRVIVVDVAARDKEPRPYRLANPEIVWISDDRATFEEGCLSFPDMYAEVRRPAEVRVRYVDEHDKRQELLASGLLATCIQHEMDHLEGVLFVDHISQLKRDMILRKLVKLKRMQEKDVQRASA